MHSVTTVAIAHFIDRFKKKRMGEICDILDNNWKETGTFAMVNANDDHIYFNSLESWPFKSLHTTSAIQLRNEF